MASSSITRIFLTISSVGPRRFVVQRRKSDGSDIYEDHSPITVREYLVKLFTVLAVEKSNFMELLAERDDEDFMHSRQERRFVAKEKDHLYINTPRLTDSYSQQCLGYWIGTNINKKQALGVARMACSVAGVPCDSITKLKM